MRGGHVIAISLCACGRIGFDTSSGTGTDDARIIDARPDADVCPAVTADIPSWPMPNDPQSIGLPNIASRTIANGRIVDNITGLEWERVLSPNAMTWSDAVAYCQTLSLDGGCWRLPERIELASINNYSIHSPSIDSMFTSTPLDDFWSNTIYANQITNRWVVRFDVGYLVDRNAGDLHRTRCVRGALDVTSARYMPSVDTVMDLRTGLEWERAVGPANNWSGARAYCDGLALAGGGWRSPSIQELETIVDTTRASMATIDPIAFPNTPQSMFWSGSEIQNDATMGWTIDFSAGFSFRPIGTLLPTRCVR